VIHLLDRGSGRAKAMSTQPAPGVVRELAALFVRLGLTAFGGPAAHIAMMRHEVVERRQWLSDEEFLDLLGATNFIPGPNSTEMAIHVGHRRAGFVGLLVAGVCFIMPAALLTLGCAWLYVRFGTLPAAGATLYGIKPVIVAVVVQALRGLSRTAVKNRLLAAIASAAVLASVLGVNELLVLFAGGMASAAFMRRERHVAPEGSRVPAFFALPATIAGTKALSSTSIFLVFAKIGSVLFGSGYVLLAFLRADLVQARHWLTEGQLLDAVAVGQFTPGPVFTTATFVGYLLDGNAGAAAATLGIFAPAFVFVALSGPLIPRLRRSPRAARFLDGLNVASLALMAVVTWSLARAALVDVWTVAFVVSSAVLLIRYEVNSAWLVIGGGIAGNVVRWLS
jgi:chromate transporter